MNKYVIILMIVALCSGACRIKKAGLPKPNNGFISIQSVK